MKTLRKSEAAAEGESLLKCTFRKQKQERKSPCFYVCHYLKYFSGSLNFPSTTYSKCR